MTGRWPHLKLELFMSPTCHKCAMTAAILRKLLAEKGLRYEETVVELDIANYPSALDRLSALGIIGTPVVIAGGKIIKGYDSTNETLMREFLAEAGL
jgi:glutaredoxin